MNSIVIAGRLARDPEIKFVNGKTLTNFVVVYSTWAKEVADRKGQFWNCSAWEKQGDFIGNYGKKGDAVTVHGEISYRDADTAEGKKRFYEVRARQIDLQERRQNAGEAQERASTPPVASLTDDPFAEE